MTEKLSWVKAAVIAAVYAGLTIAIAPIAYLEVQVRISDMLLLIPFHKRFGKEAIIGLTIGGFFANLLSPLGFLDWIFGPLVNFLVAVTVYALGEVSRKYATGKGRIPFAVVADVAGSLIIATLIGYELWLVFGVPFIIGFTGVLIGSLISLSLGVILVSWLLQAYPEE